MPLLSSIEHRQVLAETKRARASFQRELRRAPVHLIRVPYRGEVLLVAVSRSAPLVGHVVTPAADGRYTCACAGFQYRGDCAHVQAAHRLLGSAKADG